MARAVKARVKLSAPLLLIFRNAAAEGVSSASIDGGRKVAKIGSVKRLGVGEGALRAEVGEDLSNLMGTINLASACSIDHYPEVANSILNFGLPDVRSRSESVMVAKQLCADVHHAVSRFEPRLLPDGLTVARDNVTSDRELNLALRISAIMLCDPIPVHVEFVADFDRDSCQVAVKKR